MIGDFGISTRRRKNWAGRFFCIRSTPSPRATARYYLKNLLGNPYDTGVAAASLIFGGVLDAFPKLEINLPHAGGTFPWLIAGSTMERRCV